MHYDKLEKFLKTTHGEIRESQTYFQQNKQIQKFAAWNMNNSSLRYDMKDSR